MEAIGRMNLMRLLINMKQIRKIIVDLFFLRLPKSLKKNFSEISPENENILRESLINKFFNQWDKEYLKTNTGKEHLNNHLKNRLYNDRTKVIPWIDSLHKISNSRILEVGCGTGSSTVALAEQGAILTSIDIQAEHLEIARLRLKTHNLSADLYLDNSINIAKYAKDNKYDIIIFFASLEHMTFNERIVSLSKAWDSLNKNGLIIVIETPNRLFHFDDHTSLLPFYNWLPHETAVEYCKYSKRQAFKKHIEKNDDKIGALIRFGRGISYHDFELAINNFSATKNIKTLESWTKKRTTAYLVLSLIQYFSYEEKYKRLMHRLYPNINKSFFNPWLNFAITKE